MVTSGSEFRREKEGWTWSDDRGAVRLGHVTVIDAAGKPLPVSMEVTATSTVIRIPGAELASAVYPVTIDPTIGAAIRISDAGDEGNLFFFTADPAVAYNSTNDEFLVVWRGDDNVGTLVAAEYEIFGQRIDAATGEPVGANDFRISDMGPDGHVDYQALTPAVAFNSTANEYLVVWAGDDDTGALIEGEIEIFGQRIDAATGAEVGANDFRISSMGPDGDVRFLGWGPDVAYNPTHDEYLVAWSGEDDTAPLVDDEREIYVQRLDAQTGALIGGSQRISDMGSDGDPATDADWPTVAYNAAADEYLVAWSGQDQNPVVAGGSDIFIQRLDGASAAELGTNDQRVSQVGSDTTPPSVWRTVGLDVAYNDATDEYLVAWIGGTDYIYPCICDFSRFRVYGQRLAGPTGAEVGSDDFEIYGRTNTDYASIAVVANTNGEEYLISASTRPRTWKSPSTTPIRKAPTTSSTPSAACTPAAAPRR